MTNDASWEQEIRALEESHLRPEVRASAEAMDALLADDFLEFGSSGTVLSDKRRLVGSMAAAPVDIRATMSDFHARLLSPEVVLTTYRVARHDEAGVPVEHSLRSSIWKRMDDRWQMVFHQGTLTAAPDK